MPKDDINVDHYAVLNILHNASADEVKKQFRRLGWYFQKMFNSHVALFLEPQDGQG